MRHDAIVLLIATLVIPLVWISVEKVVDLSTRNNFSVVTSEEDAYVKMNRLAEQFEHDATVTMYNRPAFQRAAQRYKQDMATLTEALRTWRAAHP